MKQANSFGCKQAITLSITLLYLCSSVAAQTGSSYIGASVKNSNTYIGESADTSKTNIGHGVQKNNTVNVGTGFNEASAGGTNQINIGTAGSKTTITTRGKLSSDQSNAQIDATGNAAVVTKGYVAPKIGALGDSITVHRSAINANQASISNLNTAVSILQDSNTIQQNSINALKATAGSLPVSNGHGYVASPLSVASGNIVAGSANITTTGNINVDSLTLTGKATSAATTASDGATTLATKGYVDSKTTNNAIDNAVPYVKNTSGTRTFETSPITIGSGIYYPQSAANPTTNIGSYNFGDGTGKTSSTYIGVRAANNTILLGNQTGTNWIDIGYGVYTKNTINIGRDFFGTGADVNNANQIFIGTGANTANANAVNNNTIRIGTSGGTTTSILGKLTSDQTNTQINTTGNNAIATKNYVDSKAGMANNAIDNAVPYVKNTSGTRTLETSPITIGTTFPPVPSSPITLRTNIGSYASTAINATNYTDIGTSAGTNYTDIGTSAGANYTSIGTSSNLSTTYIGRNTTANTVIIGDNAAMNAVSIGSNAASMNMVNIGTTFAGAVGNNTTTIGGIAKYENILSNGLPAMPSAYLTADSNKVFASKGYVDAQTAGLSAISANTIPVRSDTGTSYVNSPITVDFQFQNRNTTKIGSYPNTAAGVGKSSFTFIGCAVGSEAYTMIGGSESGHTGGAGANINNTYIGSKSNYNDVGLGYQVTSRNRISLGAGFNGSGADASSNMIIDIGTSATSYHANAAKNNTINIGTAQKTTTTINGNVAFFNGNVAFSVSPVLTLASGSFDLSTEPSYYTMILLNPTAAGIAISALPGGTRAGQLLYLVNTSSFTITGITAANITKTLPVNDGETVQLIWTGTMWSPVAGM